MKKIKKRIIDAMCNFQIKHCSIKKRAMLLRKYSHVSIGERCEVYPSVSFGSEPYLITIGNDVRITAGVKFCTHDGGLWVIRKYKNIPDIDLFGEIVIGNNVHIGWDSIIMPNVHIGDNVIIGCGSIVTHDIPDNSIAAGVPAKIIKNIDEYYNQHISEFSHTKQLTPLEKEKYLKEEYNRRNGI